MVRYHSIACLSWLLLVTAAAVELAEAMSPEDLDYPVFQDDNLFDDSASSLNFQPIDVGIEDLLLYRLINALQASEDKRDRISEDSLHDERNKNYIPDEDPVALLMKGDVTKRYADKNDNKLIYKNNGQILRAPLKWKTKKEKNSQRVCYFKLCTFRYL